MKVTILRTAKDPSDPTAKTMTNTTTSLVLSSEEMAALSAILAAYVCRGNPLKTIILSELILNGPIAALKPAVSEVGSEKTEEVKFALNMLMNLREGMDESRKQFMKARSSQV